LEEAKEDAFSMMMMPDLTQIVEPPGSSNTENGVEERTEQKEGSSQGGITEGLE